MRRSRIFLLLGVIVLIPTILFFWLDQQPKAKNQDTNFAVVNQLHDLIAKESVYDVTSEKLVEGALRGMAKAIDDPYSTYYSQQEAALHKQTLASERIGIGVELSQKDGKFVVISPVKTSPADKAGIRPLDEIVQINDTRLEGKSLGDVMQLMQGKEGEEVTLVVFRPSLERHVKINVKRAKLKNETVHSEVINVEDTPIGYVTVTLFGEETGVEWQRELNSLFEKNVEALIIDVRDNPGGYLHSVAQIISTFERQEKIFAYMQKSDGKTEPLKTKYVEEFSPFIEKLKNIPITIIQNEGSASASEVFAGALQDWKRATVIGVTSFGKGTVQKSWELKNGGELKLSTNKWLTPTQRWIHHKGIEPDIEVKQHPLYGIETKLLKGRFETGEFSEEIAYSQSVLAELGYAMVRKDGFFDMETAQAVSNFRKRYDLQEGRHMDEQFFAKLTEQLQAYKASQINDMQLQMAISYVMHQLQM
ncbi:peptidase S41 [Solibacillus sp. R5-41]|uniref:S41 family peptidase n=1 Tax=Solibacillus sp. R5-41 TaxID=2048654 RepID=UPI000C12950B|nr:S41 family peptidase [Solibacillus sp. R5-41]ATP39103.1 peptidase S41 [Solibacillus sp. R5-41]